MVGGSGLMLEMGRLTRFWQRGTLVPEKSAAAEREEVKQLPVA
jgi:hypothetical protein